MTQYLILTVNREIEEREKILKALGPFQSVFEIFQAENASEAEQKLINLMESQEQLSLIICDESLPRTSLLPTVSSLRAVIQFGVGSFLL